MNTRNPVTSKYKPGPKYKKTVPLALDVLKADDEQYAQLLFQGMVQSDAIQIVRPETKNWSPNRRWTEASLWATRVERRVEELLGQLAAQNMDLQQRIIDEWAEIAFAKAEGPLTWPDKHKALSELAARLWPASQATLDVNHHLDADERLLQALEKMSEREFVALGKVIEAQGRVVE